VRDWAYNLLRLGLQTSIWGGEIVGLQNLPARGPGGVVAGRRKRQKRPAHRSAMRTAGEAG